MGDANFKDLLIEEIVVERPVVELDAEGMPQTPRYEKVAGEVAGRVMPFSAVSEDGLLGRLDDATHVLYVEPLDLRPNDRVVSCPISTSLAADVAQGDATLPVASVAGITDGMQVEVGAEGSAEVRTVIEVGVNEILIAPELVSPHAEGEPVSVVRRYDVLVIRDEAGAGHHLRAILKEIK